MLKGEPTRFDVSIVLKVAITPSFLSGSELDAYLETHLMRELQPFFVQQYDTFNASGLPQKWDQVFSDALAAQQKSISQLKHRLTAYSQV